MAAGLWPVLALVTATTFSVPVAYYRMFIGFAPWDDEGYLLLSLHEYARGGLLYEQVYSQYGPAYFQVLTLVFRVFGTSVTHIAGRGFTVAVSVAVAMVCAITVYRLTRTLWLALCAQVLLLASLGLAGEPPHPGGLLCLLASLVVLAGTFLDGRHRMTALALIGALEGLAILVKANVGVFAFASTLTALLGAMSLPPRTGAARWLAGLSILLLPLLPMAILWDVPSVRSYATVVACSAFAVGLTYLTSSAHRSLPARGLAVFLLSLALTVAASIGWELVRGASVSALVRGTILDPMSHPRAILIPVFLPPWATRWAVASLLASCTFAAVKGLGAYRHRAVAPVQGLVQMVAGFALWSPFIWLRPLDPRLQYLPWLWLALVGRGAPAADSLSLGRSLLILVAALQTLHAYPVAGSQISWATFLLIPAGAVVFAEGWAALSEWLRGHVLPEGGLGVVLASACAAAIVAGFVWRVGYAQLHYTKSYYDSAVPLALPGAESIRVRRSDAELYQWLVRELRARCRTFITQPGLNSLYLFTGMEPPTMWNVGAWPILFSPVKQAEIRDRFAAAPPPRCAVRNLRLTADWLRGRGRGESPLADYIADRFVTVSRRGDYEFMTERDASVAVLLQHERRPRFVEQFWSPRPAAR